MIFKNPILQGLLVVFVFLALFQTSVFAKDEWIKVNSKNFTLIGNASDKDIRKVATKLEQFREVFVRLFDKANFNSKIPTTVIVFKSGSSYHQFKPKRADGKIDDFVAGYFQPGEDVNYITLSTEGEGDGSFNTIFHEYVHALLEINIGKSDIPPWFNEGLAEFYETFKIENDQKVTLGSLQQRHLELLNDNKFIPLDTLFNISNYALHQSGNHSTSMFYAESWALIHYLMQGKKDAKSDQLTKFLSDVMNKVPPEKAFQDAFQMTYAEMEKELRKYVEQRSFLARLVNFKDKLIFENEMQTSPLSEAAANAYLGDLLFHTNRADDAEPFLQKALSLDPNLSMAHTALGMVKLRQRKFDEAKTYLEKAITDDQKNHLAYYQYAYLLSRDARDEFGHVSEFSPESAAKMREMLKKAIAINPEYAASYDLLAYVDLVTNEDLDEAVQYLKKALAYQPGKQQFIMRIAEIFLRQKKFAEAKQLAERIARTADEPETKSRAESLLDNIKRNEEIMARNEENRKRYEQTVANMNAKAGSGSNSSMMSRRSSAPSRAPTSEEIARAEAESKMRAINVALRKPANDEKQLLGNITKVVCAGKNITYAVKTEKESVTLFSKDFQGLALVSLNAGVENTEVGCGNDLSKVKAVLTYKPLNPAKPNIMGELLAIDFVPDNFRFIDAETANQAVDINVESQPPPGEKAGSAFEQSSGQTTEQSSPGQTIVVKDPTDRKDLDAMRRDAMMQSLKNALYKPQEGEKHQLGFLEKIECDNKGANFFFKTEKESFKFTARSMQNLKITVFTPDLEQVQFGCGLKQIDIPVIFTYRPNTDPKAKTIGELLVMEFVPKSFKLED